MAGAWHFAIIARSGKILVGVAGWGVPKELRIGQGEDEPVLSQYARLFNAVEINASFARPHRPTTYQQWARCVPPQFRFAVKVAREISHDLQLEDAAEASSRFIESAAMLKRRLGVFLLQLPPGLAFDRRIARRFFKHWRTESSLPLALEARNPTWFDSPADDLLNQFDVTRVWADPVPPGCKRPDLSAARFAYIRLHGSPRTYYSAYTNEFLDEIRSLVLARPARHVSWCIFDNTASGAAWANALSLVRKAKIGALKHTPKSGR